MDKRTRSEPAPPDDADDGGVLYVVMIKHVSRWRIFTRDSGEPAVATTLENAEAMLVEAKRHIAKHSNRETGELAASGLRLAVTGTDQL